MAPEPLSGQATARSLAQELEESVGQQLRARREETQLSLRELARRLGISPSALSQIETGKSRPSVSTLYAIVSELGMSLDELFAVGTGSVSRVARMSPPAATAAAPIDSRGSGGRVQRAATRSAIELESGVRWERLTPAPDRAVDFLYVVYEVGGASSQAAHFIRHSGREYGVVLSGTLEVTVGFETYVLGPGDSICFDSSTPHRLRNVGEVPVEGIWFAVGCDPAPADEHESAAQPIRPLT
jgi:transcriptional regulator with XRE-family HTH domain